LQGKNNERKFRKKKGTKGKEGYIKEEEEREKESSR